MSVASNLHEELKGDVAIFRIKGKLDTAAAQTLEKRLFEVLRNGQSKILLDLGEVTHVNSAGLRMLLSVKKHLKSNMGSMQVCRISHEVLEMMKICGFDHVLEICKTEEEAIRRF